MPLPLPAAPSGPRPDDRAGSQSITPFHVAHAFAITVRKRQHAARTLPAPGRRSRDTRSMPELKLIALDADDLSVLSAHMQDALVRVSDLAWLPAQKRFVAVCN